MRWRLTTEDEPQRSRRLVAMAVLLFGTGTATTTVVYGTGPYWLVLLVVFGWAALTVTTGEQLRRTWDASRQPWPAWFVLADGRFGVPASTSPVIGVFSRGALLCLWWVMVVGSWRQVANGQLADPLSVVMISVLTVLILLIVLFGVAVLATAWRGFPLELTPVGLRFRTPLARRLVPWAALAPGGPHHPPWGHTQLTLATLRPDLVVQRGWGRRLGSRQSPIVPAGLDVHPWFLADAIRWYVEHPEDRAAIGTSAGHERLLAVLTGTGTGTRPDPTPDPDPAPSTSDR